MHALEAFQRAQRGAGDAQVREIEFNHLDSCHRASIDNIDRDRCVESNGVAIMM